MALDVRIEGSGPRVVLVHGSVLGADMAWMAQAPLSERWTLVMPSRTGFGGSPAADGEDFEPDAEGVAELLEDGDHLVGHSYGGVVAMLAAAKRPDIIASLSVIEPAAFDVARGDRVVEEAITTVAGFREQHADNVELYLRAFVSWVDGSELPDPLPPPMANGGRLAFNQRSPAEAVIRLNVLRDASFPKLVVTGDSNAVIQHICDVLERELRAERAYVGGVGHMIPFAGQPLNDALEAFWTKAR